MNTNITVTLTEFQVSYLTSLLRERVVQRSAGNRKRYLTTDDYMIEGLIAFFNHKLDEKYESEYEISPIH